MKKMDSISVDKFVFVKVPGDEQNKVSIKSFVESNNLKFAKGSGFYELSKPETIQPDKEVLVQRLSDPKVLIKGNSVKEVLGIGNTKSKSKYVIDEKILKDFKVFVQSTSCNRNLVGGTSFLYRKDETDDNSTASWITGQPLPKRPRTSSPPLTQNVPVAAVQATPRAGNANATTGPVEIVISFDTTASMFPCLSTVRSVIRDTLNTLTTKIPSIRIGIIAHGDYDTPYLTQAANNYKLCSASEVSKLIEFVSTAGPNPGWTHPECYELVLREVATKFDWSEGANKSLILIGDDVPHEENDNPGQIDWRAEANVLKDKGIRVYAVQAMDRPIADLFYQTLAHITLGFHLKLHQLSSITDFLIAVCFHEGDNADSHSEQGRLAQFENEIVSSGRMVNNLHRLFNQLQGRADVAAATSTHGLTPVNPCRFQILQVDQDKSIKQFAEDRGLVFKVGRGFYEFTKPESISDKKEIVLMDKASGDFYTGAKAARELAGIEPGLKTKQIPKDVDKYIVFIQSSSYNRKLVAGQKFLYEVDFDQ